MTDTTNTQEVIHRDLLYGYKTVATFQESYRQPCRFMTSLCPDQCGHATNVYKFHLDTLQAEQGTSADTRFVTPVTEGKDHLVGEKDLGAFVDLAKSLQAGDKVNLDWNHDYVTKGGSKFPDRPVVNLAKVE